MTETGQGVSPAPPSLPPGPRRWPGSRPQQRAGRGGSACSAPDDSSRGGGQLAVAGGAGAEDGGAGRGEPEPDSGQGSPRATAPWRGSVCGPGLPRRWEDGKTVKLRGPVSREGCGGEGRGARARAMGVLRLRKAGRLPAGSSFPQLLEGGFAQALAVSCCPKNQQLHLIGLRGYTYIVLFIPLVCEPSGCTVNIHSFLCNHKG